MKIKTLKKLENFICVVNLLASLVLVFMGILGIFDIFPFSPAWSTVLTISGTIDVCLTTRYLLFHTIKPKHMQMLESYQEILNDDDARFMEYEKRIHDLEEALNTMPVELGSIEEVPLNEVN